MSGSPIPINAPATGGPRRLRRWQHEALLYGGRAVLGDEPLVPEAEENDFLGIPGLLSPEQVAVLLKQREAEIASTATRRREPGDEVDDSDAVHRLTPALRREINGLVARVARRTGQPHATVHARLRRRVPGPPSAHASVQTLRARRDDLLGEIDAG